jgi:arginine decarboxylase
MPETTALPAHKVYNIAHWSDGYIAVTPQGEVEICPDRGRTAARINLPDLTRSLAESGVALPVLIRFTDILHDRVNKLCGAFNKVTAEQGYQGRYTAVYPIKVNQQRRVVEELLAAQPAASAGQVGLEAGSKPELMAVLALAPKAGSVIVCNGYKDREYIRLALIGQKLGHRVFIVVEKQSELPLILEEAEHLEVSPLIGVRARLATIGKGNWQNTGGRSAGHPAVVALPPRLPDRQHPGYPDRLEGMRPLLHGTAPFGRPRRHCGYRRRPRRGLRGHPLPQQLLNELQCV